MQYHTTGASAFGVNQTNRRLPANHVQAGEVVLQHLLAHRDHTRSVEASAQSRLHCRR